MSQVTAAANSSLQQTKTYTNLVDKIIHSYPETNDSFQIVGTSGSTAAPSLNAAIGGMVLKPWDQRKKTTNQLQPVIQKQLNEIAGAKVAMFQPPPLPSAGSGLPIQFVIQTTSPFKQLNTIAQEVIKKAGESGKFIYMDSDLKYDQEQTTIQLNRDKVAELGLTMTDIGNTLAASLSENYLNYFDYMGRSYQVIPQMQHPFRINDNQLLHYYVTSDTGQEVPMASFATLKHTVVPEAVNHFQQLNSATISAVPGPGVTMGVALATLQNAAKNILPEGYNINYGSQSRQYIQESGALVLTFLFALIIIYLSLSVLFNSFRDPFIVLISVPMSVCGAMIFISMGIGGATLNIYTEVGLITLIGLISKARHFNRAVCQ